MTWENLVKEKKEWSEDDEIKCPYCIESFNHHIMGTYTGYHEKETMIHCDNCDNIWIVVYKISHIIKLNREIVK